jgi:riboflavin synthase
MFTGIVTDLGTVRDVQPIGGGHDHRLIIGTSPDFLAKPMPVVLGASIACSGVCLTAVQLGGDFFAVEASAETLSKTTLGGWKHAGLGRALCRAQGLHRDRRRVAHRQRG